RIARGKVTILAGHPGLGKSQLTASLAAIVTTGGIWPHDNTRCEPGNVVFFSAEDDAEDTIRPRLEAAGADLDRIFILDAVLDERGSHPRSFNLRVDLPRLGQMLMYIGGVALVVIDPITAYLGETDSHKNADIRALLSPLGELAARHDSSIVCISHLSKGGSGEALMRVTGSLAFVAAARAAFLVARDPGAANRRLFLPIKNNICRDETGLAFTLESVELPGSIETSRVCWHDTAVTITADEAMAPQEDPKERSALDEAKLFLTNLLADGPVSSRQIRADAEGAGLSWRTVQRAQKAVGIDAYKGGMNEGWFWMLPSKHAKIDEDGQQESVTLFENHGALLLNGEQMYIDVGKRYTE
ncbi:MAG TPA: AAA family ATPase, partial [Geobacteraceae bacterium]|nr:AAA family ATPase [Geobacteraceae bacterium]